MLPRWITAIGIDESGAGVAVAAYATVTRIGAGRCGLPSEPRTAVGEDGDDCTGRQGVDALLVLAGEAGVGPSAITVVTDLAV
jgi:hypothetical protein